MATPYVVSRGSGRFGSLPQTISETRAIASATCTGTGRNVTFPARQYSVNGERRSFALLRPLVDAGAQDRLRDAILRAYDEHEEQAAMAE